MSDVVHPTGTAIREHQAVVDRLAGVVLDEDAIRLNAALGAIDQVNSAHLKVVRLSRDFEREIGRSTDSWRIVNEALVKAEIEYGLVLADTRSIVCAALRGDPVVHDVEVG